MVDWKWVYKKNELVSRIKAYRDLHPENEVIANFLLNIIYLFEKEFVGEYK